jgi:hypothetical protein
LFIRSHAIQHAHQKGTSTATSNRRTSLVTLHDEGARLVIDFGIAKAIEGRLTERRSIRSCTEFIARLHESGAGGNERLTLIRSDIYNLGVRSTSCWPAATVRREGTDGSGIDAMQRRFAKRGRRRAAIRG